MYPAGFAKSAAGPVPREATSAPEASRVATAEVPDRCMPATRIGTFDTLRRMLPPGIFRGHAALLSAAAQEVLEWAHAALGDVRVAPQVPTRIEVGPWVAPFLLPEQVVVVERIHAFAGHVRVALH